MRAEKGFLRGFAKKVIDTNSLFEGDANIMDITIQIIQEIAYEVI